MSFVSHLLIKPETIEERDYQINVLNTAIKMNTLCVLPTGLGKTTLAVLLSAYRLEKFPDKKIMIMSPTRPLCAQHQEYFRKTLDIDKKDIILITGMIIPEDRKILYKKAKVIAATPQTIRNDIKRGIVDLEDFSLLIIDECHRAVKDYSYTFVADIYRKVPNGLILGLTASPGSSKQKINEICKNLSIQNVEIRTEEDRDVEPYVKGFETEWFKMDLPEELSKAQENLKSALKVRIEKLKKYNIYVKNKRELLKAQSSISKRLQTSKNPVNFYLVSLTAEGIKIWYLLELLETQSVKAARMYLEKMREKKNLSDRRVLNDQEVKNAIMILESYEKEHPKLEKLKEIIEKEDKNNRIIVFSHYRNNIKNIFDNLKEISLPVILIGQKEGLTQKEQIDVVKDFNAGVYNVLITSPIGEEGLHIPSADLAIFYDSVPSEIRTIQRRGRVGRTKLGRIIFLLTKKTRDEASYWISKRKEGKMKTILKDMQKQKGLHKFI